MGSTYIHPSAFVDAGVQIGGETKIWHFCHIMSGSRIGTSCVLGQNVFVGKEVSIGDGVKIQNNVSVYSGVEIEDDVFIGPAAVFTNVINPRSAVERKEEFRKTWIRKGATIGANATILCGIEIGRYAFVAAGAVVTKSIANYALVMGNPGRPAGWMSEMGYRLEFDAEGKARCPGDEGIYLLKDDIVTRAE